MRVIAPDVGGGFGSKIYLYAEETALVWASKRVNRPIKWTAERSESVPLRRARPRSRDARRARARQGRQVPRDARADDGDDGRVPVDVRVVHPDHPLRDAARRPVHDAGDLRRGDGVVHQHRAGRRLSRRRPARGDLRGRAPGRTRPASSWASRRTRSAGATSSARFPYQTPVALTLRHRRLRRDARRGDARSPTSRASRRARPKRPSAASCAASATRPTSRPAASRRRTSPARSARAPACSRRAKCACIRPAASPCSPARTATARATRRRSRRSSRRGSASRSTTSTSCTATPAASRSAWAPTARARSRSAARRSSRRSTRSSPRARRSPRTCSRRRTADIEFKDGKFTVAGTDRSKAFGEVALAAYVPHNYPLDKLEPGLNETAFYDPTNFTFPAGTHICEVEIDPETGVVAGRRLHRVRRLRQHHQSDDRRGPGARRPGAGHRPGAARRLRLRHGERAAPDRLLHGLRDAARRRPAVLQGRHARSRRARTIRSASRAAARPARSARRRR